MLSATAIGVWFHFPMPGLNDLLPNSLGWCLAVLGVGVMVAVVAAYGYNIVARIANYAAPWMTLVFLAFGLVGLREFLTATGTQVHSAGDFWALCQTAIWKGGAPLAGQVKFTFWHVMFFAWFCNMAMHIGMSDLSVFRYAKKSWYGVATASGMYLGHYLAWIAASILYALQLHRDPTNTDVLPGPLANNACGIAGLICVIVAGWTTANPTIYRAGLAFQAIFPKSSRYRVTLITGLIVAVFGMFPAVAMKLLGFVALYGLILMPMGAVIFCDFWLLPKFKLMPYYAEKSGLSINWAAGIAWIATLGVATWLVQTGRTQIFFVSLPGWFIAAALYIGLSKLLQKKLPPTQPAT